MPDLAGDLIKVEFEWENFNILVILTKPLLDGKKTYLTKRTCHTFCNGRPVDL